MPATRAPTLPVAAEMPWHVARMSVGNTSPGSSQVVALGPNWPKKELRKYRACSRARVSDATTLHPGVPMLHISVTCGAQCTCMRLLCRLGCTGITEVCRVYLEPVESMLHKLVVCSSAAEE